MVPPLQAWLEVAWLHQCPEEIQPVDTGAGKDGERDLAAYPLANLSGAVSQPWRYYDPGSDISRCERVRSKVEYI